MDEKKTLDFPHRLLYFTILVNLRQTGAEAEQRQPRDRFMCRVATILSYSTQITTIRVFFMLNFFLPASFARSLVRVAD